MNKYLKRSLRYFAYLTILWVVLITIMVITGYSSFGIDNINELYKSPNLLLIVGVIIVLSAVYPKMGYANKIVPKINDKKMLEDELHRIGIVKCKEEGNTTYYQYQSTAKRLMVRFDDTFTIQYNDNSAIIDGNRVMIARIWTQIEYVIEK